ncbi:MAG: T9SS type A sorting domain-containing protein, partial [Maribacter sp.]|nr:T9SS type A sorting domain-containing protein [Maribacter sp.]
TYGQLEDPLYTFTINLEQLPFEETIIDILGTLNFTPSDTCTPSTTIAISNTIQPDNYNLTYNTGNLTINKTALQIEVLSDFISEGSPTPSSFYTQINGLVCDDSIPTIDNFIIKDQNGTIQSGNLVAGEYSVFADISNLTGYDNYIISQSPGILYVNPAVGCNNRIKASDICKTPATISEHPEITTLLRFEYTNDLNVPIFIPNGSNNMLKGNAYFIGSPPELFLPGKHTFEIYTNGGRLQWEVITEGCNSASKSANGSNANPCGTSLQVSSKIFDQEEQTTTEQLILYPNPSSDYVTIITGITSEPINVRIYNETGRTLLKKQYPSSNSSEIYIDVSKFNPGILYIGVEKDEETTFYKVIKT